MSRATIILNSDKDRERAADWCRRIAEGTRVEFKAIKRSPAQNDLMWALLTDISRQVEWHGLKLLADSWKLIFLDGLKRELTIVPNIDGTGFVNISRSSSDLSKEEMSDLIELIRAFGAKHNVVFSDAEIAQTPQVRS
jgi:hypothetical protein